MMTFFVASVFFLQSAAAAAPAPARDTSLPPAEDQAGTALEKSPRRGEYIDVKLPSGGTTIRTWISYPQRKEKAGVVIVIQKSYGLTDWIRGVADQFAEEGFIAVAPDMISGLGTAGGGTEAVGAVTTRSSSHTGSRAKTRRSA